MHVRIGHQSAKKPQDSLRAALSEWTHGATGRSRQRAHEDKLVLFDRNRTVLTEMTANIARATPAQREDLVRLLVERVDASDTAAQQIAWVPAARPFFQPAVGRYECPQGDSNP